LQQIVARRLRRPAGVSPKYKFKISEEVGIMKLKIIGQGIRACQQITLEGLEALRNSKKVLYLSVNKNDDLIAFFTQWNIQNYENIRALYEDAALDKSNYERLLRKILAEVEAERDVAVLFPGHPRVGVTLVKWLEEKKTELGFELEVLPGISSFDTMMNDLSLDPLERGAQVVDANRILLFDYKIESCLDTFIYHVCSVGVSHTHLSDASQDNHLLLLQQHLEKFFPANHSIKLLSSSVDGTSKSTCEVFPLKELAQNLGKIHFGSTLFVPGLKPKFINKHFLKLVAPDLVPKRAV
jgi:uncharacterized protein YabN with tetrapyrrole methylase and pyrophosphatase domain